MVKVEAGHRQKSSQRQKYTNISSGSAHGIFVVISQPRNLFYGKLGLLITGKLFLSKM